MENRESCSTLKAVAGFWLQTIFAIGLTGYVAMAILPPPPPLWLWVVLALAIAAESATGLIVCDRSCREQDVRPSGAAIIIAATIIAIETLAGLLAAAAEYAAHDALGASDEVCVMLLAAKMATFITAAFAVFGCDLLLQDQTTASRRARADHRRSGSQLHGVIAALEQCEPADAATCLRLDVLLKRLRGLETLLSHAPGGVGSWEVGPEHALDDGGQARELVSCMARAASELRYQPVASAISQIEQQQRRLDVLIDQLSLA